MEKKYLVLGALAILFLYLYGGGMFSVFFAGGITKGFSIDQNGQYGAKTDYSYVQGAISPGTFGVTLWDVNPVSTSGFTTKPKQMSVFIRTQPNYCNYVLKQETNVLDPVYLATAGLNTVTGGDYKLYSPSTWTREQKVDVLVFGPSDGERQLAAGMKSILGASYNPTAISTANTMIQSALNGGYGQTFDAYANDVGMVGPNDVYKIIFGGTYAGQTDCGGNLDDATLILYSAQKNQIVTIDRDKVSSYGASVIVDSMKRQLGLQGAPVTAPDLSSDDLKDKVYSVGSGVLKVQNPRSGSIPLTIVVPTNLYYSPITGDITPTPGPGTTPVNVTPGGTGEPAACALEIEDIAFSGDNSNTYKEETQVTTYVKVKNPTTGECLAVVSASSSHSTAASKSVTIAGSSTVSVPMSIKFGSVPSGTIDDKMTYKVCSSGVFSGTLCTQRDVSYSLFNTPAPSPLPDPTPTPDPSPAPQPDMTCQERAQSKSCLPYEWACQLDRTVSEYACLEYFVPSIIGLTGLTIIIGGVLAYVLLTRRR